MTIAFLNRTAARNTVFLRDEIYFLETHKTCRYGKNIAQLFIKYRTVRKAGNILFKTYALNNDIYCFLITIYRL